MADRYTLTDVEGLAAHLATVLNLRLGDQANRINPAELADAALTWAADHGWSPAARKRSSNSNVAVCPQTVPGKWRIGQAGIGRPAFYDWPCVLKAGHDGDCRPDEEWDTRPVPYTELPAQELYEHLVLATGLLRSERRDRKAAIEQDREEQHHIAQLLKTAVEEGSGRTAKHGPGCWLKHVHCLAHKVLYWPGEAERLLAEHRGGGR